MSLSSDPSTPFLDLQDIHWQVVRLTLQNTRNTYARQRTLSILDAIFKYAAGAAGLSKSAYFFHPREKPLPITVRKGELYDLELVFPEATEETATLFVDGLRKHLKPGTANFKLIAAASPSLRNLQALENEFRSQMQDAGKNTIDEIDELCLNFLTPLPFSPEDTKRRWMIDTEAFFKLLVNRIRRLFGKDCHGWRNTLQGAQLLPYYWDYVELHHPSKSGKGTQFVNGMQGRLYLKGELKPLLPLLLVCSEVHAGRRTAAGQGAFRLEMHSPFFDKQLESAKTWETSLQRFVRESDRSDLREDDGEDLEQGLAHLRNEVLGGDYTSGPAQAFQVPKKNGGERTIGSFSVRDLFVQRVLKDILDPVLDRMFEECSVGYRRGKGRANASALICQAVSEGYQWVLESDVADFYDSIAWDRLSQKLDRALPVADTMTRRTLLQCIQAQLIEGDAPMTRERGLIQGSPLSPMLSNLYLDKLDEAMDESGFRMVRYADDFIVLARTREEAEQARQLVLDLLAREGLHLKQSKTFISRIDAGFEFLGLEHGGPEWDRQVAPPGLRKSLYVQHPYAFVGVDGEVVEVRKKGSTLGRVPSRRVKEIVLMGNNSVSSRLIQKCAFESIPLSFCTPSGSFIGTVFPKAKTMYDRLSAHSVRHGELSPDKRLAIASEIVRAKVANYAKWFEGKRDGQSVSLATSLVQKCASLQNAETVSALRGMEGDAAKNCFAGINRLIDIAEFKSKGRKPRAKKDPLNVLLDFAYSLLFNRLNTLLRTRGLNPYLGFLHSPQDRYESLVCDLQEPFRCRIDRMVLTAINSGAVAVDDVVQDGKGRFCMAHGKAGKFIDIFEREMSATLVGDDGNLGQLLDMQVGHLESWIQGQGELAFYAQGVFTAIA